MEEVWVVYLCMILFILIIILMKQKPADEVRKEKEKESQSTSASTTYYSSSLGKHLECTEEELEASLQRLNSILFSREAQKREPHPEHKATQPQLSQSKIQEKASHPSGHENLLDEIEQAVQEVVDTDVYARRRTHQPRRRREEGQWAEMTDKF